MTVLPPPPAAAPDRVRFRPTAALAWAVIVGVCGLLLVAHARRPPAEAAAEARPPTVDFQTLVAGRYAVGVKAFTGDKATDKTLLDAVTGAASKATEGRLAEAIVAGELDGSAEAVRRLDAIDDPDARSLIAWYRSADAGRGTGPGAAASRPAIVPGGPPAASRPVTESSSPQPATRAANLQGLEPAVLEGPVPSPAVGDAPFAFDADALRPRLGWFADLAGAYGKPDTDPGRRAVLAAARKTVLTLGVAAVLIVTAGVVGLGLFVTAIVLLSLGKLRSRVGPPAGPGYVYVESVAIYLGGFIGLQLVLRYALPDAGLAARLGLQGGLVALAAVWPLLRGAAWPAVREDWGVHAGRGVLIEILAGAGGYLAGLPVMAAMIGVTLVLKSMSDADVTHPIANEITSAPPLLLFGLAAVFAPITEELLFRGALVSHLRGVLGVPAAAVLSGLIFAAVHPQGWAAIPVLGGIGAVLALIRQWRGSLVASVTAHAINNGFVVVLLTLATH